MRILHNNLIDLAGTILTVSSQAGDYPASLLKDTLRKRRWRATGKTAENIVVQIPAGNTVCCFAITGHNLSDTATIEVLRSTNGSTYGSLATIRITPAESLGFGEDPFGFGGFGGLTPSEVLSGSTQYATFASTSTSTYPYWKVILRDIDQSTSYVEVGRIYFGSHWEPDHQIIPGWRIDVNDPSEIIQLISNQKVDNRKDLSLRLSFQLPHLSPVDALSNFLTIIRNGATKKDVFIVLFPDARSQFLRDVTTVYGRFLPDSEIGLTQTSMHIFDTGALAFEESL